MVAAQMFMPWDLRPTIIITAFTLTGVSTLVVAVRFWCRVWMVGRLKLYDYIMLAAVLCTWGLCACNHYQLKFGSGAQSPPGLKFNPNSERMTALFVGSAASWYAYQIGYVFDLFLIKISILAFYLTIATQRTFRILVYVSIVVVTAVSIVMVLLNAFQCPKHPSFALGAGILKNRGSGHCLDLRVLYYWQAGFNLVSDTFILILPLPLLIKLRMPTFKRICLVGVFSVGLLIPIASGIRLWGIFLWATSGRLARYYGGYIILWSQVELNTAIICSSAPSLQPLFKRIFSDLSTRLARSRGPYHYYGGGNTLTDISVQEMRAPRSRRPDTLDDLEYPESTYQPGKRPVHQLENGIILVKETDEEAELRARIKNFSSYRSSASAHSDAPKSPAQPKEILSCG